MSRVGGRLAVHVPDHPKANSSGHILKSRHVMEKKLGRILTSNECVHHLDLNPDNNDPSNLFVKTRSKHTKDHWASGELNCEILRKHDYAEVQRLMATGLGYRRIARAMDIPVPSAKYIVRVLKKWKGGSDLGIDHVVED